MKSSIINAIKSKKAIEHMARGLIASLAGVFVMACSGCGGGAGGGSAPAAQAAPTTAPAPKQIGILYVGDSTGAGYTYPPCGPDHGGTTCDPNTAYITSQNAPAVMDTTLSQEGFNVTMTNISHNGGALEDLMDANPVYWGKPWTQMLTNSGAQIVITNLALNDTNRTNETPEQYAANLSAWVDDVRAAGKTPVIEEPNPMCGPPPILDQLVEQMNTVAQQKQVLLIQQYKYIQSLPNWQQLLSDCTHPLPELYAIKGQREAQALTPIIRPLSGS